MGEVTLIFSLVTFGEVRIWLDTTNQSLNYKTIKGHYKCNYNKYVKIY